MKRQPQDSSQQAYIWSMRHFCVNGKDYYVPYKPHKTICKNMVLVFTQDVHNALKAFRKQRENFTPEQWDIWYERIYPFILPYIFV